MCIRDRFPGAYRAAEPSRVMRVEPQHYFAVASSAPEVAEKVGALARERIGGLQGIAMQPPKAQIAVYGERWDPACSDLRRFLCLLYTSDAADERSSVDLGG